MLHLLWQLSNTQQSWPLFLGTQALLDFRKSKLSCFSLTSLVTPVFFVWLSFYPLFWAPFLYKSLKLHIQASNLSFSWAPDFCSSLYIFYLLVTPFFFQTCLSFSLPLFCNQGKYIAYRVFQARKSSVCYNFYHLNISSLRLLLFKSNHHWSSSW